MDEREVIRCDDAGETRALRFDAGVIGKLSRTPTGGVRVPARVTREGVLTYQRSDGSMQREYRPESEVFAAQSLASLRDSAVTIAHPASGKVTPSSFRSDAVGYVPEAGRRDERFVATELVVQDEDAIRRIDSGDLIELSCGYACRIDATPGTTPGGEAYDAVQRDITYNHVALLPRGGGRAGREVALRVDGAGAEIEPPKKNESPRQEPRVERTDTMKTERIDGIDYEIGTPAWAQARQRADAKSAADLVAAEKRAKDAETAASAATARADAAEKRVKDLEAELTPARLDARVAERSSLVAKVAPVLGTETKLDGKSDLEIMKLALAKLDPELKLDGKDETYLRARFDAEIKHAVKASPLDQARADAFAGFGLPGVGTLELGTDPLLSIPSLADAGPLSGRG